MNVVTKVIAKWLKPIMGKFVGSTQSSYIPGRQVGDNIFVAQEIIHSMKKKKGRQGYMAVKIYLEKSYDRIE